MILHPLSLPVDIGLASGPDDVDGASLVSIINTNAAVIYITVLDAVPTRIGIAAGERVLLEKDYIVQIVASTAADGTGDPAANTVLATKVAYAG
jgi:hypothetical protein